jgi:hypothetical protein
MLLKGCVSEIADLETNFETGTNSELASTDTNRCQPPPTTFTYIFAEQA